MRKIYSIKQINYLAEHGVFPLYDDDELPAIYKESQKLSELLEKYIIERVCVPNKY